MTSRRPSRAAILVSFIALVPACEEKKAAPPVEKSADAGAARSPGVDKNISEAVAAVAGNGDPKAAQQGGPPPTGVFAPGAAEKEIRQGDAPKLSIGNKGSGPTVTFAVGMPKKKLELKIEVTVQTGPRTAMPTTELAVSVEPGEKKEDSPTIDAIAKVQSAKIVPEQLAQLPPGSDKQIGQLKGSRIRLSFGANGGQVVAIEPSKDMDDQLSPILRSAADLVAVSALPWPTEPVGAGAFWMVTSRENFSGLDVVCYRMVKLSQVQGEAASLEISTKRYVASGQLAFAGMPPHHIEEFSGDSTEQLTVLASDPAALQGQGVGVLGAVATPQGAPTPGGPPPGQKMQLRLEMRTRVASKR